MRGGVTCLLRHSLPALPIASSEIVAGLEVLVGSYYPSPCSAVFYSPLPLVFLIYEYIISSGDDVKLFATSRLTGASILYLTNIVIPFITNAMALIGFARMSDKVQCIHYILAVPILMTRAEASSHTYPLPFFGHR